MFNPMGQFNQRVLEGLVKAGHRYFVRQTYPRGREPFDPTVKEAFLMCHYENYFKAKEHFDVLQNDRYRSMYDWGELEDRRKLLIAANFPDGYRVWANAFAPGWEMGVTPTLKEKIKEYIKRIGWKIRRDEMIEPQFYPHFGEVYVCLQYGGREVRVKFEEIEKTF
jgi:hypothetical protein